MKYIFSLAIALILIFNSTQAQVLTVNKITQEQNQWCWVGVSKCILDYYGYTKSQCQIAEYTRTVATWHSFGSQSCCVNPSGDCNYWNYNWGSTGSIQDILIHFGNIQNVGKSYALTLSDAQTEISNGKPFIIRWAWTSGGGHFIVGHGISGDNVYYMNPWYGEGHKIALYSWVVSNSDHSWTHTNVITSATPNDIEDMGLDKNIDVYPNPSDGRFNVIFKNLNERRVDVSFLNINGEILHSESVVCQSDFYKHEIGLNNCLPGVYLLRISFDDACVTRRIVVTGK